MSLRIAAGFAALLSIASFARSRPVDMPVTPRHGAAQAAAAAHGRPLVIPAGPPSALLQPPPADGGDWSFAQTAAPPFAFAAGGDVAGRALDCLTAAVYYEARSEAPEGQQAVAQVVLNRVRNPAYPPSVCGVVYQGSERRTGCQFTFTCDGSLLAPRDPNSWARARQVALQALAGNVYAPVGPALYYHTTAVSPWWAPSLTRIAQIGSHIFYRLGDAWSQRLNYRQAYAGQEPAAGAEAAAAVGTLEAAAQQSGDGVDYVAVGKDTISIHRGATLAHTAVSIHRGGAGEAAQTAAATPAAVTPAAIADEGAGQVRVHHGSEVVPSGGEQG